MAINRKIQSSKVPKPILRNYVYFNPVSTPLWLDKDGITFYGGTGQKLQYSVNCDTAATPTWVDIYTFPSSQGQLVTGFEQLPNGEALVVCTQVGQGTNLSRVYKSTGWNYGIGRLTATWLEVLMTIGGEIYRNYSLHGFNYGKNGVVVMGEGGSQTAGGAGNEASDIVKARRVWVSKDFGDTWQLIFDIYTFGQSRGVAYPTTVHMHGVSYDEDDDRIIACFGDAGAAQSGDDIAGAGNIQVAYSDDLGTTWNLWPQPQFWNWSGQVGAILQFIVCIPLADCLIFTPDISQPTCPMVYPKIGYRAYGDPHPTVSIGSGVTHVPRKVNKDRTCPMFFGGATPTSTQTGTLEVRLAVTEDGGFTWVRLSESVPLQNPALTTWGYTDAFGPTINGKLVLKAQHSTNNDTSKKYIQVEFIPGRPGPEKASGLDSIADGGVIAHGLNGIPIDVSVSATVINRDVVITAVDATNLTIALKDLTGATVSVAEPVRWAASL